MSSQSAQDQSSQKKPETKTIYTIESFVPSASNISIINFKSYANSKLGESGTIKYNGNYFSVKMAGLVTPFGAKQVVIEGQQQDASRQPKYSLEFSIVEDSSVQCMLEDFDQAIVDYLDQKNPVTDRIVGYKKIKGENVRTPRDGISAMYKSNIKDGKTKDDGTTYDRTFSCSITPSGQFATEFYDSNSKLIPVHYDVNGDPSTFLSNVCPSHSKCNILVSAMFWKSDSKFVLKWQVRQVKVFPPENVTQKGVCVLDDDPDVSNEMANDPEVNDSTSFEE